MAPAAYPVVAIVLSMKPAIVPPVPKIAILDLAFFIHTPIKRQHINNF